jgi:hypothetical protein
MPKTEVDVRLRSSILIEEIDFLFVIGPRRTVAALKSPGLVFVN